MFNASSTVTRVRMSGLKIVSRTTMLVLLNVVAILATRCVSDVHRHDSGVSTLLTREWVEQRLGSSDIVFSVPWPLQRRTPELLPQVLSLIQEEVSLWHEAEGITIAVTYLRLGADASFSLTAGADGVIATMKSSPGVVSVQASRSEESVLGLDAIYVDAVAKHQDGGRHQFHEILFRDGSQVWQLALMHPFDRPDGEILWAKLRNGIRRRAA